MIDQSDAILAIPPNHKTKHDLKLDAGLQLQVLKLVQSIMPAALLPTKRIPQLTSSTRSLRCLYSTPLSITPIKLNKPPCESYTLQNSLFIYPMVLSLNVNVFVNIFVN
mmetsp:Transcript_44440/g.71233  ORF Transcript_44440/g.71233 Transcript_44440/m.71233 type:complete len:109 (+) Transcript_44440:2371-2697(+)